MTDNLDERLAEVERDIDDQGSPSLDDSRWLVRRLRDALAENERLRNERDATAANALREIDKISAERDDYIGRYETAHASRMHAEDCYRRELVRADAAEAKLAAVSEYANRMLTANGMSWCSIHGRTLRELLDAEAVTDR